MRIINVPIEPYEERYTQQWYDWFEYYLKDKDHITVLGEPLTDKVEVGSVLDVYGTHHYKYTQLAKIVKLIREGEIKTGDIIFFHDLWFPGLEGLAYIRDMSGINFQIRGVLHAGTWDENDFTFKNGMRYWGEHIENGWLAFVDKIYVGSQYHKDLIIQSQQVAEHKIKVTGLPFDSKEVCRIKKGKGKENIIVFPHRLEEEKNPHLFDTLKKVLEPHLENWQFIKTKDVCTTKEEYFELLSKAKIAVSFAEQETFGYAMLESISNHCVPVVPNQVSYSTMLLYEDYRYNSFDQCLSKILDIAKYGTHYITRNTLYQVEQFAPDKIIPKFFE